MTAAYTYTLDCAKETASRGLLTGADYFTVEIGSSIALRVSDLRALARSLVQSRCWRLPSVYTELDGQRVMLYDWAAE